MRSRGWQKRTSWLGPCIAAAPRGSLAACPLSGCASGGSVGSGVSTYTIHAIISETGSAAFLGVEQKAALQALAKHVNATGGDAGQKLALAVSDNQATPGT